MELIRADKPAGVPLSGAEPGQDSFVEYLSRQRGLALAVLHHVPDGASGAVVFEATGATDRPVPSGTPVRSAVSAACRWVALVRGEEAPGPIPADALWQRVSRQGHWALWEAQSAVEFGEPAPSARAPVPTGRNSPSTALHLSEVDLTFADGCTCRHRSTAPVAFQQSQLVDPSGQTDRPHLRAWLDGLDRRQRLFDDTPDAAIRLLHSEDPRLRCDRFGRRCWYYWFADRPPTGTDLEDAATLSDMAGAADWTLHWMQDRGRDPQARRRWGSGGPEEWEITEHGLTYILSQERGLSPGLFLDQRQNRRWVLENSAGRRVLNLFAYTGGFGLCAARGGAIEVSNVDVGKRALGWARQNFVRNGLDGEGVEFRPVDARLFLEGCRRRSRTFDLVVCDAPSFGRSREGVWKIDRDLAGLISAAAAVLAPGGDILVSTNYEGWDQGALEEAVRQELGSRSGLELAPLPPADWDFELPGQPPVLKALRLHSG